MNILTKALEHLLQLRQMGLNYHIRGECEDIKSIAKFFTNFGLKCSITESKEDGILLIFVPYHGNCITEDGYKKMQIYLKLEDLCS